VSTRSAFAGLALALTALPLPTLSEPPGVRPVAPPRKPWTHRLRGHQLDPM